MLCLRCLLLVAPGSQRSGRSRRARLVARLLPIIGAIGRDLEKAQAQTWSKLQEEAVQAALARSRGFEPPTPSSASWCSIR